MKLTQIKVPEMAIDGMMAYAAVQFDHQALDPKDSFHSNGEAFIAPTVMAGLHGVASASTLIGAWVKAYNESSDAAKPLLAQGLWEGVKAAGFGMQIAPSLGVLGAGLVAGGVLGDLCSGWVGDSIHDFQANRQASKAKGPQGCAGPED
ncbi:MAG: hypothetical protein ACYCW6_24940 [Candidatus Xenobia bacterium]